MAKSKDIFADQVEVAALEMGKPGLRLTTDATLVLNGGSSSLELSGFRKDERPEHRRDAALPPSNWRTRSAVDIRCYLAARSDAIDTC
jgi:hypothetical protein